MIILVVFVSPSLAGNIEEYKLSLKYQEELNQTIRHGIESLRQNESKAIVKLRNIEFTINQKLRSLDKLDTKIIGLQTEKFRLQDKLEQLKKSINVEELSLVKQMQFFYKVNQQNIAKVIFSSLDKSQTNKISAWFKYLLTQRLKTIQILEYKIKRQSKVQKQFAQKQLKVLGAIKEQNLAINKLRAYHKNNHKLLASIRQDLKSDLKMLQQGEEDFKALQFMIDKLTGTVRKLNIAVNNIESFANLKGKLNYPTNYQAVKSGRSLIFQAKDNSKVESVASGRVIFSDWMRGYGLLTIVDHGDDFLSLYGRNKVLFKDRGEWVQSGDILGKVGDTGGIAGSGLFFELRKNGKPISTKSWFKKS